MGHRNVYLNDALEAQLELEGRSGGRSAGVAITRAALGETLKSAPPGSAAHRHAGRLRLVTAADKVLAVLEIGKGVPAQVVCDRAGVDLDVTHETLVNLSRLKDDDGNSLVIADRIDDGPILWSLAP